MFDQPDPPRGLTMRRLEKPAALSKSYQTKAGIKRSTNAMAANTPKKTSSLGFLATSQQTMSSASAITVSSFQPMPFQLQTQYISHSD